MDQEYNLSVSDYHRNLAEQIHESKKHIRQLKRVSPGIFPEHDELIAARRELKTARERAKAAEHAWKNLGK